MNQKKFINLGILLVFLMIGFHFIGCGSGSTEEGETPPPTDKDASPQLEEMWVQEQVLFTPMEEIPVEIKEFMALFSEEELAIMRGDALMHYDFKHKNVPLPENDEAYIERLKDFGIKTDMETLTALFEKQKAMMDLDFPPEELILYIKSYLYGNLLPAEE